MPAIETAVDSKWFKEEIIMKYNHKTTVLVWHFLIDKHDVLRSNTLQRGMIYK
jgi:hypothetical protein